MDYRSKTALSVVVLSGCVTTGGILLGTAHQSAGWILVILGIATAPLAAVISLDE